jgi:hypothetical protein
VNARMQISRTASQSLSRYGRMLGMMVGILFC